MSTSATLANRSPVVSSRAEEGLGRRVWLTLSTAFAAISGLAPHILHHAGPLAGAALALFAAVVLDLHLRDRSPDRRRGRGRELRPRDGAAGGRNGAPASRFR